MHYGGVIDYDHANVPLYEGKRSPVALVFGDLLYLNYFLCPSCRIVGYKLAT